MVAEHGLASEHFTQERQRILNACRHITEGGVIDQIAHVGAASIPGLTVSCIELAITAWPFPLPASTLMTLAGLGYTPVSSAENSSFLHLRHTDGLFHLYIWTAGAEPWFDLVFTCDYLRHDRVTHQRWSTALLVPTPTPALVAEARAWRVQHHGFAPLYAITNELRDFSAPWYLSSGWALDLFLGQTTRCHYDVDVVVARQDQVVLQQYLADRGWRFATYLEGKLDPWPLHMRLELPRHQVHAHRADAFIDFLLTDIKDGIWRYRREPSIVQSVERTILQTADGLCFLAPELVLLFKSKNTSNHERAKDQADFERIYPHLDRARRAWLYWALLTLAPQHPWLALLS
jgi:hypothetical protein